MLIFSGATPVLQVDDVGRSLAWYRDVLGFAADPFPSEPPYAFAILTRDRAEVMLQCDREGGPALDASKATTPPRAGWAIYLRLRGGNLLACAETVGAKTTILRGPERMFHGHVEFEVADPDGHRICLSELLPPEANVPRALEGRDESESSR